MRATTRIHRHPAAPMTMHDFFIAPFTDFAFMRRALAACIALAAGGTPLGTFMTLRRMALVGDAMSHALLPGVAAAFLIFGAAIGPMTLGGLAAGLLVAMAAAGLTRFTQMKEDSSFTVCYLLSIAGGAILLSLKGSSADLLHFLFGNVLAIDNASLALIAGIACLTLFALAAMYRGLVLDCFDPAFLRASKRGGGWVGPLFFALLMLNLVAAFQALGTLMALGLILLPAIAARFWTQRLDRAIPLSIAFAMLASVSGLLASWHASLPSGPAVIAAAGVVCLVSIAAGRHGSILRYALGRD